MKKFLLVTMAFAFSCVTFGQDYTISGTIKDASNGEDVIGASVYIKELIGVGAVTNVYGFYSLTLEKGNYTLVFESLNYKTVEQKIVLDKKMTINKELQENVLEIGVVDIIGEAEDQSISKTEMSVENISPKEIETIPVLLGEPDIIKTFTLLPGVKTAGEGNGGFFVRGGGTDQNLILLDEAVVYNASHLLGFFSVFNSDAIKDVKLYKGGMPAKYGGRGSSVMDITMRDGNSKKFGASGGLGIISSRLTLEGPIVKDKGSFIISGRRSYADIFTKLSKKESIKNASLYFYDLNMKANYRLNEKNRFYMSGYFGRDVLGFDKLFGFDWGNLTGTVRWNHLFGDKLFSNTSLIYNQYDYKISIFDNEGDLEIKAKINDVNFKEDFSYYANDKNTIKFGLNIIHHTFAPGELSGTDANFNSLKLKDKLALESAAYVQNEQKISPLFSVQYGVRYSMFNYMGNNDTINTFDENGIITARNYYSKNDLITTYGGFEPRFAAKYSLNETSSLKLSYNRNYQYLHLLSSATTSSPTDSWVPTSNNIKPQIVDQIAVGYFKNLKKNSYEFSVELYYKNLQNQIDYKNGANLFLNGDVEKELTYGKGIAYGSEWYLKKKKGKLTGWISYTYARSLRKFDKINEGEFYPARQDIIHDFSIVGMYKMSEKWALSSTWVYKTGLAVTFPTGKYEIDGVVIPAYSNRNGARFPAYHRLDVGATYYRKKSEKLESSWNFSIYNAYGRENTYSIEFKDDPDNPGETIAEQTALFKIIPSVTYNFKF